MASIDATSTADRAYLIQRSILIAMALVVVLGFTGLPFASADENVSELSRLQLENESNARKVANLEEQAVGYNDAINKLAAQIEALQAKIEENTAQQKRLETEIEAKQRELDIQKKLLGYNIKAIYLEGNITTLEMLAASKDLSEFVDKEQYRNAVQTKIQRTMEKIQTLQLELRSRKDAVTLLLKDQTAKKAALDTSRQKQNDLLAYNIRQRDEFNQKTEKNRERISELIARQRTSNLNPDGGYYFVRFPGSIRAFNPGDYIYRDSGFSMQLGFCSNDDEWPDSPDKWGYCTRQCVSYTAWAVEASGRAAPRYWGNAKDWLMSAYLNAVPVYRKPKAGDIAISTGGEWGHAMYVERVDGDRFFTSEYNTYMDGKLHTNVERRLK